MLYYQIIHNRVIRRVATPHRILSAEWNGDAGRVLVSSRESPRYVSVAAIASDVAWEMKRFAELAKSFEGGHCAVDEVADAFLKEREDKGLFRFMRRQAERLRVLGRERCGETMDCTLRSFMQFRGWADIDLDALTKDVADGYEARLKAKGLRRNTSSFYMRTLHTAYRAAVDEGLTEDRNPFRGVYTGVDKTVRRAIPLEQIRAIRRLDLCGRPALELARDLLMFSFYTRGMSFVDMAFLRKSDMRGGRIVYRRRKTGRELTIEVAPEARGLIAKFAAQTRYLLPIITAEDGEERRQCKNRITTVNRNLKKIGRMAGLSTPLSTYVMRHSWATIARNKGIALPVISEALGHESEVTTHIYLDSISTAEVDRANRAILDDL